MRSTWGKTPRRSVEEECARRGKHAVVAGCVALLNGDHADPELIVALGGPPARWALTGAPAGPDYWLRVWAARGLLWAWDDAALPALLAALDDEAWRVREAALRAVARHRLTGAATKTAALEDDAVPRVRTAAGRASAALAAGSSDKV